MALISIDSLKFLFLMKTPQVFFFIKKKKKNLIDSFRVYVCVLDGRDVYVFLLKKKKKKNDMVVE